jgi:hypothetical protein
LRVVIWIATTGSQFIGQGKINVTEWGDILALTGVTASMTVNALVTGLIVFRIFRVFTVSSVTTSDETSLGITGGRKLRSIIFIIIESGAALFAIQLARLVLSFVQSIDDALDAFEVIIGIHEMLNVTISSIILYILLMTWP